MARDKENRALRNTSEASCDVRVWSATCEHSEFTNVGDKYLCAACGNIVGLTHEVHHEVFPHVSGDDDNLS